MMICWTYSGVILSSKTYGPGAANVVDKRCPNHTGATTLTARACTPLDH